MVTLYIFKNFYPYISLFCCFLFFCHNINPFYNLFSFLSFCCIILVIFPVKGVIKVFKKLIKLLLSPLNFQLIYSTTNIDQHLKIVGKLQNNNVPFKTKIKTSSLSSRSRNPRSSFLPNYTTYEIRVKKEYLHEANNAIHTTVYINVST